MRILRTILTLASFVFAAEEVSIDTKQYDGTFTNLQNERKGLSKSEAYGIKSPFKIVRKEANATNGETGEANVMLLTAIMGNKARINGSWYQLGSVIGGYKMIAVGKTKVILANNQDKQELKLTRGGKDIDIKIK